MDDENEWFVSWFNSPYYPMLYRHRDHSEAGHFISNLLNFLQLNKKSRVLDLACGQGRHSIQLNAAGMVVTGIDLSPRNIEEARKSEKKGLNFEVQDMRSLELDGDFDLALNLFTSFGYFRDLMDNELVLNGLYKLIKPKGKLVIDYLNCTKVASGSLGSYTERIGSCQFIVYKEITNGFIRKSIEVQDGKDTFHFEENVQEFSLSNFTEMLNKSGFSVIQTFGSYDLQPFTEAQSDRLIIVAERI